MARCRKCNAFILFATKSGLCKKCLEDMVNPPAEAEKPVVREPENQDESTKKPDPYEHYGSFKKEFHFDKPEEGNLDEINRWLKKYSFSYLMVNEHDQVTGTTTDKTGKKISDFCWLTDMELECKKEVGKELNSYQIAAFAFDSKGKDEDEKTQERYKQDTLNKYPGAVITYHSRCTYSNGRCALIILVCIKKD